MHRTAAASAGPPRSRASRTAMTPRAARRIPAEAGSRRRLPTPGISNRTAWPTGTVQGKSLPVRKYPSAFQQYFLKSMNNRSR